MNNEATDPQTKHADKMILPSSSWKHLQLYFGVHGSWETSHQFFHLSSSSPFIFFMQNLHQG